MKHLWWIAVLIVSAAYVIADLPPELKENWMYLMPLVPVGFEDYNSNYTGTRSVIINLYTQPSAESCRFINHDNPAGRPTPASENWSLWESCSNTRYWLLDSQLGLKTVYLEVNYTTTTLLLNDSIYYNTTGCGLDGSPPSSVVITDGEFASDNNTISVSWSEAADFEQDLLNLPLTYIYVIYENHSGMNILDSGTTQSTSLASSDHSQEIGHNYTVYVNITAMNCAGLGTTTVSDGLVIDLAPPLAPSVGVGLFLNLSDNTWQDASEHLWLHTRDGYCNWSSSDDLSGISAYSYLVTQNPSLVPDNLPEGVPGYLSQEIEAFFSGIPSGTWYLRVKARDGAGNWGPANTYTVHVDSSPPERSMLTGQAFDSLTGNITYTWTPSSDGESGVAFYSINITNKMGYSNISAIINATTYEYDAPGTGVFNATIGAMNSAGIWRWSFERIVKTDFEPPQISAKPAGTIASDDAIISVWTDEVATCSYNWTDGMKNFAYGNSTYHEAREEVADSVTYKVLIICADPSGNTNSGTLTFTPDTSASIDDMDIYYSPAFGGQLCNISFNASSSGDAIGELRKEDFDFRLDRAATDFSLVDSGEGRYSLFFTAPAAAGTKQATLSVDDYQANISVVVMSIYLNVFYTDALTSGQQLDYIGYDVRVGSHAGIGTDSPSPSVDVTAGHINMSSQAEDSLYVFLTRKGPYLASRSEYLRKKQFVDLLNPSFGFPLGENHIYKYILGYGRYGDIIGNLSISPGKHHILAYYEDSPGTLVSVNRAVSLN